MDPIERKLRADIRKYGWHVLNVLPDGGHPPHSYSVGLYRTFSHPEIVVVGLPGERSHKFINNLADEIKDGATFEAGSRYDHIIEGYDVAFVRVGERVFAEHFGRAIDFYGSSHFPVLQMVWPDRNSHFPWEPQCEESIQKLQPVLGVRPN